MKLHCTALDQITGAVMESELVFQQVSRPEPFSFREVPRLTKALSRGDEDAFRWLHAQWNARLARYCFALSSGDEALAADVVQATYLRILRHIRELPDEAALWAWLLCAARSAATDLRRTNGRYTRALARFAEWFAPRRRVPAPDPEPLLIEALTRAIENLPPDDRALLEARYSSHESLASIGERCGLSTRAVEGRMARLRDRLRREITAHMKAAERQTDGRAFDGATSGQQPTRQVESIPTSPDSPNVEP